MERSHTSGVRAAIDASDATVIAVSPNRSGGSHEPTIRPHRNLIAAQPSGRFLVVGGEPGRLKLTAFALRTPPDPARSLQRSRYFLDHSRSLPCLAGS